MAWTLVNQVSRATAAASTTLALTGLPAPAAGNLVVLCIQAIDDVSSTGNESVSSIAQTNVTWVQATSGQQGFNNSKCTSLWYGVPVGTAGTTATITCANGDSAGSDISANYTEWNGVFTPTPLDTAASTGAISTTPSTPTITTAKANELVVGTFGNGNTVALTSSGWTALTETDSSGGGFTAQCYSAYRLAGGAGESEQATWSASNTQFAACIAAFTAAGWVGGQGVIPGAAGHYRVWTMINRK